MKYPLIVLLSFLPAIAFFMYYESSNQNYKLGSVEVKKSNILGEKHALSEFILINKINTSKIYERMFPKNLSRTQKNLLIANSGNSKQIKLILNSDSTSKERVLLIGDSEAGGLIFPLNAACKANGYSLGCALIWNAATTFNFAYADTLESIIDQYKPSYIFIAMGLNEMEAKDLERRRKAAVIFEKRLKGIPYSWIGPANYTEDFGINKVFQESAQSGTFFYSGKLNLPKGPDGRHPNTQGYRIWMDSISSWLNTNAKYKLPMTAAVNHKVTLKTKMIQLNAAKFRGYE
jgi:hypothetical protein